MVFNFEGNFTSMSNSKQINKIQNIEIHYPENNEEVKSDNIDMLKGISEKIDYSQILGLNNTVITIKK